MGNTINFADDITIDENRLDQEWLSQATLFMKYAEQAATAKRAYDISKEQLDVLVAQVDNQVREDSTNRNIKTTEDKIKNLIMLDPSVQEKKLEVIDKLYELNIYSNLTKAFDHRKSALEQLVKLYNMGYFADPVSDKKDNLDNRATDVQKKHVRKYDFE